MAGVPPLEVMEGAPLTPLPGFAWPSTPLLALGASQAREGGTSDVGISLGEKATSQGAATQAVS